MRRLLSFSSLRFKAMVTISALIVLTTSVLGGFLFNNLRNEMKLELLKWGESTARQIAHSSEYGVLTENSSELTNVLQAITLHDEFLYAVVQDSTGRILSQYDRLNAEELVRWIATRDFDQNISKDTTTVSYRTVPELNKEMVEFSFPVRTTTFDMALEDLGATTIDDKAYASTSDRIGLVRLGVSLDGVRDKIFSAARITALIIFLVTIAVIALTAVLVNVIIKPIDNLVNAAEIIATGDMSHFVAEGSVDEINRLARAFNAMVRSLRDSRDEIEVYNRTLELKIAERTRELEQAQSQLVQSEKLSAIGQLAAGVAHELNNPMGGILGYAQFALEKISKSEPGTISQRDLDSQKKYLTDIEQQARRCRAIIKNLLKFSRSSDKKEWENFDINVTLNETVSLIQHQLDLGNITLVKDMADSLPKLHGNPSQMQQVFTNLLLNAQHAMSDGGEMRLSTRLAPRLGEFSGCVEVTVEDTGVGIDESHVHRIFEPFFTTKDKGKGTGLGLSISYGIVKEHGGDIAVHSVVGKGTKFTVILPLETTASGASEETGTQASRRAESRLQ
jgi:signal transduction histidine kinase